MTYLFNLMLALRTFVLESIFESFYCSPSSFVENLKYMGIGMLVIFVVIGIIAVATALINKIFSR
jgi:hypothetical protein